MTTASDLVHETRRHLLSSSLELYGTLTGALNSSATSFAVAGGVSSFVSKVIEIDAELIFVWAAAGGTISSAYRGWMGTTAAAHSDGALVTVSPRWPTINIYQALSTEIVSYASPVHGLYSTQTLALTSGANTAGYNLTGLTGELIDINDVRIDLPGMVGDWPLVRSWELDRDADLTAFPSGYALRIHDGLLPGRAIRIQYRAGFTALPTPIALATNLTTTGLPASAYDIPPLGAAAKLLATREARRAQFDAQPEPRQAAEVAPGVNRAAAGGLLALRNQRLVEERVRLQGRYPSMSRRVG